MTVRRRFELAGTPTRFWEIGVMGVKDKRFVRMEWGPIGGVKQSADRAKDGEAELHAYMEQQIAMQIAKGYVEVNPETEPSVARRQRFEWRIGKTRHFGELAQDSAVFSQRIGRVIDGSEVLTKSRTSTVTHDSIRRATEAYDDALAEILLLGGVPLALIRAADLANPELEALCRASPDASAPWAVYADWLLAHNDGAGEVAALRLAGKEAEADALLVKHHELLCLIDPVTCELEFRHGFAVAATLRAGDEDALDKLTEAFLESSMARFVETLRFGVAGYERDWGATLRAVAAAPQAKHLRVLRFDAFDDEDAQISWVRMGDFSRAWSHLPALEHLQIRSGAGGNLGKPALPSLTTFIRESGGLAAKELSAICAAKWPALQHLEIWTGSSHYGAQATVEMLQPIFDARGLSQLTHLGICNSELVAELIPALATSRLLPQLRSLDLSKGVLASASTLVASAGRFAHLASIDLRENVLSPEACAEIAGALPQADVRDQRFDRYVAVGE